MAYPGRQLSKDQYRVVGYLPYYLASNAGVESLQDNVKLP